MADQVKNRDEYDDIAIYDVADKKTTPASKDSSNEYSILNVSTQNKDGLYAGTLTGKPVLSKEGIKPTKVTNYTRMACCLAILSAVVAIIVICFIATCATLYLEIARLKVESSRREALFNGRIESSVSMLNQQQVQATSEVEGLFQQLNSSFNQLMMSQEVSLQALNLSLQMNLLQHGDLLNELQRLHLGQYEASPVSSCAALDDLPWSTPSGYYWVRASNSSAVRVYCDMTRSCGNVTGGWTRVAELNMTNSSHQCPSGFRQHTDSTIRTCVSDSPSTSGCQQIFFASIYSYSQVCGKIIAYQVGSTDAFDQTFGTAAEENFVDGISLTHGSPRQHVWTFAAGSNEERQQSYACPCINGSLVTSPSFVGDDYFCETGNRGDNLPIDGQFYPELLWDGEGCGSQSACCTFNTPPWFYKQLPQPTTDDIEMRVCTDEPRNTEDIAIEIIDIYIQ
jgi:hypothetical protein